MKLETCLNTAPAARNFRPTRDSATSAASRSAKKIVLVEEQPVVVAACRRAAGRRRTCSHQFSQCDRGTCGAGSRECRCSCSRPSPGPLALAVPIAGGFFAVYLYRRRTGQQVTRVGRSSPGMDLRASSFSRSSTMLFTMLVLMLSQPELVQSMRDQMAKMSSISPRANSPSASIFCGTPSGLALVLLDAFLILHAANRSRRCGRREDSEPALKSPAAPSPRRRK